MELKDVEFITLGRVPAYLKQIEGVSRTRQAIHNWAVKGFNKNGQIIKLKTVKRVRYLYTTRKWVRDFLANFDK